MSLKVKLQKWANKGAAIKPCGRMCSECAFKKGGAANNEPHNVDAAVTALSWGGQFNCHQHDSSGKLIDAGKPCVGFEQAKQYLKSKEVI